MNFLSDEEDTEVFQVYKEEMLQFMINNHKRGKQAIEDYEKKLVVSFVNILHLFIDTHIHTNSLNVVR